MEPKNFSRKGDISVNDDFEENMHKLTCVGILVRVILIGLCAAITAAVYGTYWVYNVVESGELILDNAPGEVSIVREADTKIIHIRGENW